MKEFLSGIHGVFMFVYLTFLFFSCSKFLDEKPTKTIATPNTLTDIRALLDDEGYVNNFFSGNLEVGTDDYFMGESPLETYTSYDRAFYYWEDQGNATYYFGWTYPYRAATIANVALESLDRIGATGAEANVLRGEAYFIRAFAHYNLSQVYCREYDPTLDNSVLPGIPLRLNSDMNGPENRASLEDTYRQILDDLQLALDMLPETSDYVTRANRTAAYAVSARVYLSMERYVDALEMANAALSRNNYLLDYNQLDIDADYPFVNTNPEIIFFGHSTDVKQVFLDPSCYIDTLLIAEYEDNDLRLPVYFSRETNGYYTFKAPLAATFSSYFGGPVTDEMYLIKAECESRVGELIEGIGALNALLVKRFKTGTFIDIQVENKEELLRIILKERRKSLIFRGLRWSDLRRLNKDSRFAKTLTRRRTNAGVDEIVSLPPGDLRYVYLIPLPVLQYSTYTQNER
ncbi:RagB/SusD family nutrient uptake outer membrane protein [Sphingobacterium sp. LRF_L2]|uniref:RagB/SusD family nutrient uptake outer membrane protein n=1 Tax=Sphingobacterium sp. LRF_L2 TaxID=3369421 RepID=UPI003F600B58